MNLLFKQVATLFVLTSFLMIALGNFAVMIHGQNSQMPGDCPFSAIGVSLCPQNTTAVAVHHIATFNSFINVPVLSFKILLALLLLIVGIVLIFSISSLRFKPPSQIGVYHNFSPEIIVDKKIIRWLSLFENSPSFL